MRFRAFVLLKLSDPVRNGDGKNTFYLFLCIKQYLSLYTYAYRATGLYCTFRMGKGIIYPTQMSYFRTAVVLKANEEDRIFTTEGFPCFLLYHNCETNRPRNEVMSG